MNFVTTYLRTSIISVLFLNTLTISGQLPSRELFNIYFENNFNDDQVGSYQNGDFTSDWKLPNGSLLLHKIDILYEDDVHGKFMRGYFPAGTFMDKNSGWSWYSPLSVKCNELYFSFDVRFKPGFQWVMGGKIPGVTGGNIVSGVKPTPTDGFSARLMWGQNGNAISYVYHQDQESIYGSSYFWGNFIFVPGRWYNFTVRVVLNTVENNTGLYNGILEGFIDDKLVFQKINFRFRSLESISIDNLYICSFFGGNTAEYAALKDEWIDTDNYLAYTYGNSILNIPHGNLKSSFAKALVHPYHNIPDASWKKSLKSTAATLTTIDLIWEDFPVPSGYTLERQESGSSNFVVVGNFNYGTFAFTDANLKSGVTYTYRLKAGNTYSDLLTVSTHVPIIPLSPGNLLIAGQSKTSLKLIWTDNSTNETGFKLERALAPNLTFQEIALLPSNSTSYTDNNLQPGTSYYYRIRAYNTDGHSPYSSNLLAATLALDLPAAPAGLKTVYTDYTSTQLSWTDNSNNESAFEVERSGEGLTEKTCSFFLNSNIVTLVDTGLIMDGFYRYRVRARNNDGYSAWSNVVDVTIPRMPKPANPSNLKSLKFTDKSITISWKDNSNNEEAFVIIRSLASDPTSQITIRVNANDTTYTDCDLLSSTSYLYTVKAVNLGGNSESNKNVASTLSLSEMKRVREGLIGYYNFGFSADYILYDQSAFGDPLNLEVINPSAVKWNDNNSLEILSNTVLVSQVPATKIIKAVKNSGEFTFECWIKPAEPDEFFDSRIVSLGNSELDMGFLLDQHLNNDSTLKYLDYSVRMQTESTVSSGYPTYQPDRSRSYINLLHVVYTRDSAGSENMYVNGVKSSSGFRPSKLNSWNDNFTLRLGNETDMLHPWKGTYYSVAIYNRALTMDDVLVNYSAGTCDELSHDNISYRLEISPNPTSDFAKIIVTPEETDESADVVSKVSLLVYDLNGTVLSEDNIFNPYSRFEKTINFEFFPAGIYFVQIRSGKKQKTVKLAVNKNRLWNF